ncbi:TetR/AcrR family transcriptional regulator [Streptomyces sp. MMBL 11-3]|uniref:TetR/AcrR family transcriptional regulator n=1 Tax=Streptomyces sp. MMBL 11-3 TaxID=3382639 RepID=UPI0039B6E46F
MIADPAPSNQRADAKRSRARLLEAAAAAFAQTQSPTFKDIAKAAGVGIGTLYRHFPTREALVEAVYRAELDHLCDSTQELLAALPADEALREWMGRYSTFVATKRGMADALQSLIATGTVTKSETGPRLTAAIQSILDAGRATGTLRADIPAGDVTAALTGTLLVAGSSDQQDQAQRLLDLLMDGLTAPPRRDSPTGRSG